MKCQKTLLITTMIFAFFALSLLGIFITKPAPCLADAECQDGHLCPAHWMCCERGCCDVGVSVGVGTAPPHRVAETPPPPPQPPPHRDADEPPLKEHNYGYPWYAQWSVLFLLGTLGGIMICCVWCLFFKRPPGHGVYMCSFACCVRRPTSEHDSAGSVYPPPRYSRCGSFHQAPPPYSEVASKPDLYPLVITCGEGDGKAGNYLMVHYFRNYVIRAPGSLSATSTAESLNSSFICNAANEANTIVPPPYSCASNYEECGVGCGPLLRSLSSLTEPRAAAAPTRPEPPPPRAREPPAAFRDNLITSPVQPLDPNFDLELELIDCEMYCDGGCKPRLGSSPPVNRSLDEVDDSMYMHEAYGSLRQYFTGMPDPPESPPQPTSPTQTSRDSTLRRPSDERRQRRLESVKKTPRQRKTSLYMPLSVAYPVRTSRISPGTRASSRSAPATPCSSLVPNLLAFSQRVSASRNGSRSSKFEEESDPLLAELEHTRTDHKF
ncbi:uncharacterized protein LOC113508786 isoform X2 [Trichoplusia ni]|uniref:Uncharacterized protein LOC113508786 isoform X2 n=1 Tax=Trichoplusia ni TaxID=7111 RepID=A0A7E5X4T0_TRINI|nr:uncharacterized protein LOC113508786 isoform X2 [Trichoplusia ni]